MKNKKCLYIIRCNNSNFYKIGISEIPEERLQALQIGCPYPLSLIYKRYFKEPTKVEKLFHKKYHSQQKNGEWFELSESEIYLIQQGQLMDNLLPNYTPMLNKIRAKDGLPPIKL